ncbi:MAG TPA: hypothetical protein V6C97_02020, partial [Oculatellaceae cyanobacterium]
NRNQERVTLMRDNPSSSSAQKPQEPTSGQPSNLSWRFARVVTSYLLNKIFIKYVYVWKHVRALMSSADIL